MTVHLITAAVDFKPNKEYSDKFKRLFMPRQQAYADFHGMIYDPITEWPTRYITREDHEKAHSSLLFLQVLIMQKKLEEVPDGDIVVWIDADIAPIKGWRNIADIKKNIAIAFDQAGGGFFKGPFMGPNIGVISARACPFTREFFKKSFERTDCEPWPFSSNMGVNLTIGDLSRQVVLDNFEELPRTVNVTLDQYKAGVKEEDIEFKHFAGGEKIDAKYFSKPVDFTRPESYGETLPRHGREEGSIPSGRTNFAVPPYGRRESFDKVRAIVEKMKNPNILEIGSLRIKGNWDGDGYSSALFAYLANVTEGKFKTVDINPETSNLCRGVISELGLLTDRVSVVTDDAIVFTEEYGKHSHDLVDVLYLDAWDPDAPGAAENHMTCFKNIEPSLAPGHLIIIDDILDPVSFNGKGKILIPFLMKGGYECVHVGYQFVFRKK